MDLRRVRARNLRDHAGGRRDTGHDRDRVPPGRHRADTIASGTSFTRTTTIRYAVTGGGHVPVSRPDNAAGVCTYTYDGRGHLLSLTDPTGIVTSASYDTLGRQVSTAVSSAGGTALTSRFVAYSDLTRTVTETTATGSITLIRDGRQRIIQKVRSDRTVRRTSFTTKPISRLPPAASPR